MGTNEQRFLNDYDVGYQDGSQDCASNCVNPRSYYGVDLYSSGYKQGFNDQYLKHQGWNWKPDGEPTTPPPPPQPLPPPNSGDAAVLHLINGNKVVYIKPGEICDISFNGQLIGTLAMPNVTRRQFIQPAGVAVAFFLFVALLVLLLDKDVPR